MLSDCSTRNPVKNSNAACVPRSWKKKMPAPKRSARLVHEP